MSVWNGVPSENTTEHLWKIEKFDVPGELREVRVVIMKKETERSFVCKAKYYSEFAKHKSHQEKLQQKK